ncbi:hypothetical protein [Maribacter sp. R77961]|uniref:hypothetical protein n=1 Tax=Maribacter sp. R77961 TaxID=3093871 RepID=UPI0037CB66FE
MINNKQVKKHFTIQRTLLFLLIGSLLFAAGKNFTMLEWPTFADTTAPNEDIPEYFDYGMISDSTYCNNFFKFRITITKGYETAYKKYENISATVKENDSVLVRQPLASDIIDHELLVVTPGLIKVDWRKALKETGSIKAWIEYDKIRRDKDLFGPEHCLIIRAHRLTNQSLDNYIHQFSNMHNPGYGESQTKIIADKTFNVYEGLEVQNSPEASTMFRLLGGENKQITTYLIEQNDFALSINLFYKTEAQKIKLLKMVQTITFH